ncbi:MAG: type II secretion system protein [Bacilli bacterium]|nr:type II secretion system protein [Bacilli bacterium]
MKKLGFTLVELLAVIVILGIILAIAVPTISGIVDSSANNAFQSNAKMLIKSINYKKMSNESYNVTEIDETNVESELEADDSNYQNLVVSTFKGEPYIVIEGKNKWNGKIVYGTFKNMSITTSDSYDEIISHLGYDADESVNEPKLATGMTPIKWNGTELVETTVNDPDWYSYDTTDKKWANAKTSDGSMWVWIPRYIYKIPTANWHTNTAGVINIQLSVGIDDTINNTVTLVNNGGASDSNNNWTSHPAFWWDNDSDGIRETGEELTGIWVAKFEATALEGVANISTSFGSCPSSTDDVTTKTVKVIPNVPSWRCLTIGNMFTNSRNMETNAIYGWGTSSNNIDTHLMKNSEWGAVAYLSNSAYGLNGSEMWVNPSKNTTTGCAGDTATSSYTVGCVNAYNTIKGVNATTTGTIYGVYDMAGGAAEEVSAYVNNGNAALTTYSSSMLAANLKYKDLYTVGSPDDIAHNYLLTANIKGDALYEISSTNTTWQDYNAWYGKSSVVFRTSAAWLLRGGWFDYPTNNGPFQFFYGVGSAYGYYGFRPVLLVGAGL